MKAWMTYNPACGTARNVLALLRARGMEPEIREYLKDPLTRGEIAALAAQMGEPGNSQRSSGPLAPANAAAPHDQVRREAGATFKVADLVRWKETQEVAAAGITPDSPDTDLLDAMAAMPVLLNRPIVRTARGVKLCWPSESVEALL